jgi:ribosomal protein L11 methyltransferase
MKQWIEVKMLIKKGIEDEVASILLGEGSHGVFTKEKKSETFFDSPPETAGENVLLFAYFLTEKEKRETFNKIKEKFGENVSEISVSVLGDEELSENWKSYFRIVEVLDFAVIPSWMEYKGTKIPVKITCGLAFGTGTHPTTRTCLYAVQKYIKKNPVKKMLDVGCGSGILSIVAAKMGVERCVGIDIDGRCVETSKFNAMINGVKERTEFLHCSIEDVKEQFPFIVANIYHTILLEIKNPLINSLEENGILILSGITEGYRVALTNEFTRETELLESIKEDFWVTLVLKKTKKQL